MTAADLDTASSPAPPTGTATRRRDSAVQAHRHRADIQALRAFAVSVVVLFHVAPGLVKGGFVGVDVFFVISGFLVGGGLFHRAASGNPLSPREFFARRARRIMPVSALVAAFTIGWAALTASPLDLMLWGPTPTTPTFTRDAIASITGLSNLWFGTSDQGYLADGYQSPFTQYWSLGVEEQFYVTAPLVLALLFWLVRSRKAATLVIALLSVVSLDLALYGATLGGVGPFFNPLTRAWELGVGLLVAVVASRLPIDATGRRWSGLATIVGWVVLLGCIFALNAHGVWPSALTLVPVGATALTLVAGSRRQPGAIMSLAPVRWLGDRSYSVYLWHWPFVVIVGHLVAGHAVAAALGVIVATLVTSCASYRWIESPLRRLPVSTPRDANRTLAICASIAGTALLMVFVIGASASSGKASTEINAAPYVAVPAGTSGQDFATVVPQNLRPGLVSASNDLPLANTDGCNVTAHTGDTTPTSCVYGSSGPLIALYGDSHALQWLGALLPGTSDGAYRIAIVTADGCPPFGGSGPEYRPGCAIWQPAAIAHLRELVPALVLVSASTWRDHDYTDDELSTIALGLRELGTALGGLNVAWVADTPSHAFFPNECALENLRDLDNCATQPQAALNSPLTPMFRAEADANSWAWIDMNDYLCSAERCGVVLGDVFMYRDDDHMTSTFSTELAPRLRELVTPLLGQDTSPPR